MYAWIEPNEGAGRFCVGALSLATALAGCRAAPRTEPLSVAAASDLSFAFGEIGTLFERRTGKPVVFSFGSSGLLARQIAEGAPFDLYAAANVAFVDDVVNKGACDGGTRARYARGRLALWSLRDQPLPADLRELGGSRYRRIALANPEHAPYGRAAEQALRSLGSWTALDAKLVYAENVRQALQFAESGNADVAFVALSLALVTKGGRYHVIGANLHEPIDQALVICGRGPKRDSARLFAELVVSSEGRAIMRRYGFVLPAD